MSQSFWTCKELQLVCKTAGLLAAAARLLTMSPWGES